MLYNRHTFPILHGHVAEHMMAWEPDIDKPLSYLSPCTRNYKHHETVLAWHMHLNIIRLHLWAHFLLFIHEPQPGMVWICLPPQLHSTLSKHALSNMAHRHATAGAWTVAEPHLSFPVHSPDHNMALVLLRSVPQGQRSPAGAGKGQHRDLVLRHLGKELVQALRLDRSNLGQLQQLVRHKLLQGFHFERPIKPAGHDGASAAKRVQAACMHAVEALQKAMQARPLRRRHTPSDFAVTAFDQTVVVPLYQRSS